MKRILFLFLLFSNIAFARTDGPLVGYAFKDCYVYALRMLTSGDTTLNKLSRTILKPGTKTIYVVKTAHVNSLPDTMNGYNIRCINIDSAKNILYKEQSKKNAAILYMDKIYHYGSYYNTILLPVTMVKKGRKKKVDYNLYGYKVFYYFEDPISQFRYDRSEFVDYSPPVVKGK